MKIFLRNIINYLGAFIVFADAYSSRSIFSQFEFRGSYFILPVVLILCIIVSRKIYFNMNFTIIFGIIVIYSVYSILIGNSTTLFVSKSVIGILLNSATFYALYKLNNGDVKKIFVIYLNLAFFTALIGLAQEVNNIFKILPPFGETIPLNEIPLYRVTSIFREPQHFCEAMIPAFFVSLVSVLKGNILINRWKSWVIIISFILTFSSVGYVGIFISIILIIINYDKIKYLFAGAIIVPLLFVIVYLNVNEIKIRVDGTYDVVSGKTDLLKTNWSTFSLISNWKIGFISFMANPVFGSGLGSHTVTYYRNINNVIHDDIKKVGRLGYMALNVEDASALFNRLLSETGLFGLFAFIIYMYKGHVLKKNDKSSYLWIINNAILVFFILKLLRGGHYFLFGTFLFFWAYYFSKLQSYRFKTELEH